MSMLVSSVLAEVEADVRRHFALHIAHHGSSSAPPPPTSLSLLTPEDWAAVLRPLAPDADLTATGTYRDLLCYTQMRCAELPMRLHMEALQTRRYEHLLRQHMRELVSVSEFVALVRQTPPTLVAAPRGGADSQQQPVLTETAQLPSDVRVLLAPEEVGRRLDRAAVRIGELEALLLLDAEAKVRCCQRMVLLSAFVRSLLRRVQREGKGEKAVLGAKRSRSEEAEEKHTVERRV